MIKIKSIIVLFLSFIVGCSTSHQTKNFIDVPQNEEPSVVKIKRSPKGGGGLTPWMIKANGKEIGLLRGTEFIHFETSDKVLNLSAKAKVDVIHIFCIIFVPIILLNPETDFFEFQLEPGNAYHILFTAHGGIPFVLTKVDER